MLCGCPERRWQAVEARGNRCRACCQSVCPSVVPCLQDDQGGDLKDSSEAGYLVRGNGKLRIGLISRCEALLEKGTRIYAFSRVASSSNSNMYQLILVSCWSKGGSVKVFRFQVGNNISPPQEHVSSFDHTGTDPSMAGLDDGIPRHPGYLVNIVSP